MFTLHETIEVMPLGEYILPSGLNILNISLGVLLRKFQPNVFFGYRISWIIQSKDLSKKTHDFATKMHIATGSILMLPMILEPSPLIPVTGILLAALTTIFFALKSKIHTRANEQKY